MSVSRLSLLLSKNDLDLADAPFMLPISDSLDRGATIHCHVSFTSKAATPLHRLVASFLSPLGPSPLRLQGSVTSTKTLLSAYAGDLILSPGAEMADARLIITAGYEPSCPSCEATLDAAFTGEVLLPRGSLIEAITLRGRLIVPLPGVFLGPQPPAGSLYLEATVAATLYNALGVPNMHLAYGVVRQPLRGGPIAYYALSSVLSLGAACTPDDIDVPSCCDKGTATSALSPTDSGEDMMVGVVPLTSLSRVLAFTGLNCASPSSPCAPLHDIELPLGALVSYAPRLHAFLHTSPTTHQNEVYSVPRGFSGQGQAVAWGEAGAEAVWVSDLERGEALVNVKLGRMHAGPLVLTGVESVEAGPTFGARGTAGGTEGVVYFLQGHVSLWGLAKYAYIPIVEGQASLRVSGRFGGGGLVGRVDARAKAGNWTRWICEGVVTKEGVEELRRAYLPQAVAKACTASAKKGRPAPKCGAADVGGMLGAVVLCSVAFRAMLHEGCTAKTGKLPGRADFGYKGMVYSAEVDVDVGDSAKSGDALGEVVYGLHAGGWKAWKGKQRGGGCGAAAALGDERPPVWGRTVAEFDLPPPEVMRAAVLQANKDAHLRAGGGDAWEARRGVVVEGRREAVREEYRRRREAFALDESVGAAAIEGYMGGAFGEEEHKVEGEYSGLLTDAIGRAGDKGGAGRMREVGGGGGAARWERDGMVGEAERDVGAVEAEVERPLEAAADLAARGEKKAVTWLGGLAEGGEGAGGDGVEGGMVGEAGPMAARGRWGGQHRRRGGGGAQVDAGRAGGRGGRRDRGAVDGAGGGGSGMGRGGARERKLRELKARSDAVRRRGGGEGGGARYGQGRKDGDGGRVARLEGEVGRLEGLDRMAKRLEGVSRREKKGLGGEGGGGTLEMCSRRFRGRGRRWRGGWRG